MSVPERKRCVCARVQALHPCQRLGLSLGICMGDGDRGRRSLRLKGFDYTQTAVYFVTLCCNRRACLFGEVVRGEMVLNAWGEVVAQEWLRSFEMREELGLDAWVVMPNHFHGLVWFDRAVLERLGAIQREAATEGSPASGPWPLRRRARSLGSMIAGFKAASTRRINQLRHTAAPPIWQRNYHEIIVRDDRMLHNVRAYIRNNPRSWSGDSLR